MATFAVRRVGNEPTRAGEIAGPLPESAAPQHDIFFLPTHQQAKMPDVGVVLSGVHAMRRVLIAMTYMLIAIAGAYLCVAFFENSGRPRAILTLTGAFVFLVGVYMLWIEFVSPKKA